MLNNHVLAVGIVLLLVFVHWREVGFSSFYYGVTICALCDLLMKTTG